MLSLQTVPSDASHAPTTRLDDYESWSYSDSHNDLPLLERVNHPVAVDPDPRLRAEAERRGWTLLSLRP